ncbi:MAG: DUF2330 domain-containing protein [Woeseiaceae bacterium]
MRYLISLAAAATLLAVGSLAQAFCGFYVARADTSLFNEASQVVLVRDGNRTVLTMANDFEGDVADFAVVIPVPTFIERGQINVAEKALIDHLDAFTSPRLVEYHDPDPCMRYEYMQKNSREMQALPESTADMDRAARAKGVTIEASYTVGEYDILILSASESSGLISWLNDNDYRIPDGAEKVVGSYLKQDMRFFVAKVNLEEQQKSGTSYLRPLQVAFESSKFMLPIRLGTLNARGQQELYVYTLTRTGRVETRNYRTVKLPSNTDVPEFVQDEFADFYRAMFTQQTEVENGRAVFLEYAWDMAWCDPCAADPLTQDELRRLGVFWEGNEAFVTRLHVRYDQQHFPEDLMFQETGDRSNYQGRYVIRHPFKGQLTCDASGYEASVRERQELEAQQLANLTGWDLAEIRDKIAWYGGKTPQGEEPWWKKLWG